MALFSRNNTQKKEETTATKTAKKQSTPAPVAREIDRDLASVIVAPRVTEKAVGMGEKNVYAFIVRRDATKFDVRDAVKALFNVTPVKVNIVNKAPRQYMAKMKGRRLTEKGMKKAYVYLKDGDSISLM